MTGAIHGCAQWGWTSAGDIAGDSSGSGSLTTTRMSVTPRGLKLAERRVLIDLAFSGPPGVTADFAQELLRALFYDPASWIEVRRPDGTTIEFVAHLPGDIMHIERLPAAPSFICRVSIDTLDELRSGSYRVRLRPGAPFERFLQTVQAPAENQRLVARIDNRWHRFTVEYVPRQVADARE
jgi:hypothetical protein